MTQGVSDRPWQAEARTAETKQFIRDIKRITRPVSSPPRRRSALSWRAFVTTRPSEASVAGKVSAPAPTVPGLKDFMEAGKERLTRDMARDATKGEVQ